MMDHVAQDKRFDRYTMFNKCMNSLQNKPQISCILALSNRGLQLKFANYTSSHRFFKLR